MIRRTILLALTACVFAACQSKTDLGKPCTLIRRDPADSTGKHSIPLKNSEIRPGRDFISFGSTECDDLVCVRDSAQAVTADAGADALGYCSQSCVQTSTVGCPAADPADDSDPIKRLSCRALLLDETTLAAICQSDPTTCQKYFGDTKSPYFCARGAKPDAGI